MNLIPSLLPFLFIGSAWLFHNADQTPPTSSPVRAEEMVSGLTSPWAIDFLPGGDWLITDKPGTLYRSAPGKPLQKVTGVPEVWLNGQGGLLDVKAHPDFARNRWIYLSYSTTTKGSREGNTRLMRAELNGTTLSEQKILLTGTPPSGGNVHFGSRIAFDKDGYLFLSIGERGSKENAQDLTNHSGKIHRLHDDGRIPSDNPFLKTAGAIPSIYSYGHRNPQGMLWDSTRQILWAHEHGPKGGDEINIIRKGINYGWPVITYGVNYSGTKITDKTHQEGMEQPVLVWTPSIAPCGLELVTSDRYPGWKGSLLAGSLSYTHIRRVILNGNSVIGQEELLPGIGRVRDIAQGPDGWIYFSIENPGKIYRLMPVGK